MINEILLTGAENATSGTDICAMLHISKRELTATVERERRDGHPICASTDAKNPGYYLAANKDEMQRYCNSLSTGREKSIKPAVRVWGQWTNCRKARFDNGKEKYRRFR